MQPNLYGRDLGIVGTQRVEDLDHEIVVGILAVEMETRQMQKIGLRSVFHALHFQVVVQWNGVEHRLDVVVPIRPPFHDVETQVDFTAGENYHNLHSFFISNDKKGQQHHWPERAPCCNHRAQR